MKCDKCNRQVDATNSMYCNNCGRVYCDGCNSGLCDCLSELKYFN